MTERFDARDLFQVLIQMLAHLVFGSSDEAQADLVADQAGEGADTKRHAIEQRVEHAGVAAQLTDALFAPGQVVDFFLGGMLHGLAHLWQLGGQGLALIERLGADFTGMVDAHQASDVAGLAFVQFHIRLDDRRTGGRVGR